MSDRTRHRTIAWVLLACAIVLSQSPQVRSEEPHPLKPADTSSPRATLQSFLSNINEVYRLLDKEDIKDGSDAMKVYQLRAIRCLDSSKIAPTAADDVAEKRAVLLSEILDRIELPDLMTVPDANEALFRKITRWRIPNTEIAIVQMSEGPRQGEFLFSAETVARIPEFHERSRHLPFKPGTVLERAYERLYNSSQPVVPTSDGPLKPADLSSPHATLRSFMDSMNALYRSYKADDPNEALKVAKRDHLRRAVSCLNVSKVPLRAQRETETQAAVLLMEVFDRIKLPPDELVPEEQAVKRDNITRWIVPNTEITMAIVEEGPRKGEFLFTPETVRRVGAFYDRVAHLPYKEGTVLEDAYLIHLQGTGPTIPVSWVLALPEWLKILVFGQPLWKWLGMLLIGLLLLAGLTVVYRLGNQATSDDQPVPLRQKLLFPIAGLCLTYAAELAIEELRPLQEVAVLAYTVGSLLISAFLVWLVAIVSNAFAEAVIRFPHLNTQEIDAQLVRIAFRLLTLVAVVVIIILTADSLAVPLTPVLAGLGIGGLAVALAAQTSIENLIGGLSLFMDRPVRVGDFCRFGDRVGTVEEIGLRSTRIRTLDDTLVSIPNGVFAKMELENFSRRRKIWYHPRLQIEKSCTPDQVRFVLIEVRKLLYAHPKVDPEPARIRFAEFGPSSLDLDIFAYIKVTDFGEFLEVAEDLNLRIMELLDQAGLRLAVPAQRTLIEPGAHPDPEQGQQCEREVQNWRENHQLYLPSFPAEVVAQLRESLEWPPNGTPVKPETNSKAEQP